MPPEYGSRECQSIDLDSARESEFWNSVVVVYKRYAGKYLFPLGVLLNETSYFMIQKLMLENYSKVEHNSVVLY